jgi:hypothetical protein
MRPSDPVIKSNHRAVGAPYQDLHLVRDLRLMTYFQ